MPIPGRLDRRDHSIAQLKTQVHKHLEERPTRTAQRLAGLAISYARLSARALTQVPLSPDDGPDDLIVKAEYAEFLDRTGLHELRPDVDLNMSAPGHYRQLEGEISAYRYTVAIEEEREISFEKAVAGWYDRVYLPVVRIIQERSLLRGFTGRTETDLYVWILRHRAELGQELGREIGPEAAASDLADKLGSRRGRILARVVDRLRKVLKQDRHAIPS